MGETGLKEEYHNNYYSKSYVKIMARKKTYGRRLDKLLQGTNTTDQLSLSLSLKRLNQRSQAQDSAKEEVGLAKPSLRISQPYNTCKTCNLFPVNQESKVSLETCPKQRVCSQKHTPRCHRISAVQRFSKDFRGLLVLTFFF